MIGRRLRQAPEVPAACRVKRIIIVVAGAAPPDAASSSCVTRMRAAARPMRCSTLFGRVIVSGGGAAGGHSRGVLIGCNCGRLAGCGGAGHRPAAGRLYSPDRPIGYSTCRAGRVASGSSTFQNNTSSERGSKLTFWKRSIGSGIAVPIGARKLKVAACTVPNGEAIRCQPDAGAPAVREESGEVLIADRCRHQRDSAGAEPEARGETRAHNTDTRRHHHPTRTRNASRSQTTNAPQWRECDRFIYCRVNVAKALIADARQTLRHARRAMIDARCAKVPRGAARTRRIESSLTTIAGTVPRQPSELVSLPSAACAAASRAIGTRNGEHDT